MTRCRRNLLILSAHELRTPIQPIIGLSEVLRYRKPEGQLQQDKILDVIIRNAKRLRNLSEDILDVTRIESNSLLLNKEKFDLNQLILNAIADSRNYRTIKNKDNDIKIEPVFNGKDICIEADKNRINQVISNLLTNAIKFTKQGTITILTETKEGNGDGLDGRKGVIVAVRDSGIGIDLVILPKLFTKFTSRPVSGALLRSASAAPPGRQSSGSPRIVMPPDPPDQCRAAVARAVPTRSGEVRLVGVGRQIDGDALVEAAVVERVDLVGELAVGLRAAARGPRCSSSRRGHRRTRPAALRASRERSGRRTRACRGARGSRARAAAGSRGKPSIFRAASRTMSRPIITWPISCPPWCTWPRPGDSPARGACRCRAGWPPP